mmetsp:Transcript_21870/g.69825  ORF Transcript_21870/g.69825 Transcript_21870/m.69825 type:complete len:248 (-) Transcript_21870:599-1342(-)
MHPSHSLWPARRWRPRLALPLLTEGMSPPDGGDAAALHASQRSSARDAAVQSAPRVARGALIGRAPPHRQRLRRHCLPDDALARPIGPAALALGHQKGGHLAFHPARAAASGADAAGRVEPPRAHHTPQYRGLSRCAARPGRPAVPRARGVRLLALQPRAGAPVRAHTVRRARPLAPALFARRGPQRGLRRRRRPRLPSHGAPDAARRRQVGQRAAQLRGLPRAAPLPRQALLREAVRPGGVAAPPP